MAKESSRPGFFDRRQTKFVSTSKAIFKAEDSNKKTGEN
jgi:hypothetical protein